jgi:phosphocarrier protein HPr
LEHLIEMGASDEVKIKFTIRNKLGLHARPAALFVKTANKFQSNLIVQRGKQKVNGKSIMGIMMLAAGPGSKITVTAKGVDAQESVIALEELVNNNFGEGLK